MSFVARETSRTLGAPIALFLFRYGPNVDDIYAYTNSEDVVTYDNGTGAVDYIPAPVTNEEITVSGALDKATINLHVIKTLAIVDIFAVWPPSNVVTLKIYQGHVGEPEFQVLWTGRILGTQNDDNDENQCIFVCEPISTSFRRSGLRRNYGYGCPHALYSQGPGLCNANQATATVVAVVQNNDSPYVSLPANWNGAHPQAKYLNGIATWTDVNGHVELRSIIQITSPTEIELSGYCPTLLNGANLQLALGCDHIYNGMSSDCQVLHNNINNFGGDPWIPIKNPIGLLNNFT